MPVPILVIILAVIAPFGFAGGLYLWGQVGDVPWIAVDFFPDDEFSPEPVSSPTTDTEAPVERLDALPSPLAAQDRPELRGPDIPAGYTVVRWAEGLERPTQVDFAPDGTLFVAQQWAGEIRLVREGVVLDQPRIRIATEEELRGSNPPASGERGLVGLALHPDFARNGVLYAYANLGETPDSAVATNSLFRVVMDGDTVEEVTRALDFVPASRTNSHNGGGMAFGPDGSLYIGIGDGGEQPREGNPAQDPNDPRGKVLRVFLDEGGNPTDWEVYASGFRNPYGLTFNLLSNELLATENGPLNTDELNVVMPRGNHGWPLFLGKVGEPGYADPAITWTPVIVPTGLVFYQGPMTFLANDLLMCSFGGDRVLHWIRFPLAGQFLGAPEFDRELARGCATDVVVGPDGLIYTVDLLEGVINRVGPAPEE